MNSTDKIQKHFRLQKTQKAALKRLNLETIRDLLYHFPTRYSHLSTIKTVSNLNDGDTATIYGTITNLKTKKSFRTKIPLAEAKVTDIEGNTLKAIWFNQPYIAKMIKEDTATKLSGRITIKDNQKTITNPEFEHLPDLPIDSHSSLFQNETQTEFGFPIYPETRGITSKWFYHAIKKILSQNTHKQLTDPVPTYILKDLNLPRLETALVWIHIPKTEKTKESAQKRFAWEEVFFIQLKKQRDRLYFKSLYKNNYKINEEKLNHFINDFPFKLTKAQKNAIDEIKSDIQSNEPMQRLLEGDVGSGKTAVAATVTYGAITSNSKQKYPQVAYMAPTEILATQLFDNFIQHFKKHNLKIALLTGKTCKKFPSKVNKDHWTTISKNTVKKWVKNGEIQILIGTHALISKSVDFRHLSLVIIDEQHRFGTKQRKDLAKKTGHSPHFLSMTATPIPRTLALTIYGDLDLSVLNESPKGRQPVTTKIVTNDKRKKVYDHLRKEIKAGRQAYIICPRINEPDKDKEKALITKSVVEEAKRLQESIFPDLKIAHLHGKMNKKEKETIMADFSNHQYDILVSTSVIEVGINIPNATNIIIEGAERFGLAQLHQLRGRVLRSNHKPYCFLFADIKSEKTQTRLKALEKAKNGFELAEYDLMQRGTGDLAGLKQWGMSDIGMEAIKNPKLVEFARKYSKDIITNDPNLDNFPLLKQTIKNQNYQIHEE